MGLHARVSVQADCQTAEIFLFGGHFVCVLRGGDAYETEKVINQAADQSPDHSYFYQSNKGKEKPCTPNVSSSRYLSSG